MLRLQGLRPHPPVAQGVKLICDKAEQSLPVSLGRVTSISVASAELFELVVQVAHGVFIIR